MGTRSAGKGSLGGLKPRARCAGFSVAEIGNRKERLRDYASFPDDFDLSPLNHPITPIKTSRDTLHPETGVTSLTIALRGTSEGWDYEFADHKKCRGAHGASQKREVQKPQVSGGVWGKAPKRRKA